MSKTSIYNDLFSTKIISTKEFIISGEKPYNIYLNRLIQHYVIKKTMNVIDYYVLKYRLSFAR